LARRACTPCAAPGTCCVPIKLLRSFAFRQGLVYLALFALSALALLGFIYGFSAGYLSRQTDATIAAEITALEERYQAAGLAGLQRQIARRVRRQKPTTSSLYLLADRNYRPLTGNLSRWPAAARREEAGAWVDFTIGGAVDGDDFFAPRPARARVFRLRGGYRLLVGRDLHDLQQVREAIARALLLGLLITFLLALGGALVSSRSATRRIETINQAARDIMQGDLSRRIQSHGSGDDLDQLTENLNRMLARIEQLMSGVRRVSDNIAHDLRTPLARLRGRLESIRDGEGGGAALDEALADTDRLLATFNSLLRIARIESAAGAAGRAVDLAAVVRDAVELYQPLAEGKGQSVVAHINPAPQVRGDHHLWFQALANLLDNAVKFTPPGGRIGVELATTGRGPQITVTDSGPGIAEEMREKVFQRFFRAEQSRSTAGNGLGLSLVKAVADMHRVTITLGDNRPGLRVELQF